MTKKTDENNTERNAEKLQLKNDVIVFLNVSILKKPMVLLEETDNNTGMRRTNRYRVMSSYQEDLFFLNVYLFSFSSQPNARATCFQSFPPAPPNGHVDVAKYYPSTQLCGG